MLDERLREMDVHLVAPRSICFGLSAGRMAGLELVAIAVGC